MKKGVIVSLIVLIVLILGGLLFLNCSFKNLIGFGLKCQTEKAVSVSNVDLCNDLSRDKQVSICYKEYAIKKKDPFVCEDIPNRLEIMNCYRDLEGSGNIITLCEGLPDGVEKPNCLTAFINNRLGTDKEIICDDLGTLEDINYCYMVTAIGKNDASICENIDNSEFSTGVEDCKTNVEMQNRN